MTVTTTQTDTNTSNQQQQTKEVKFSTPGDWITSETRMMQRIDHLQSEMVELYRRCMMIITETELLREGIEAVADTVPTYEISETEEEKPEFIEDLEQEEEEIKEEEPKEDETNSRV